MKSQEEADEVLNEEINENDEETQASERARARHSRRVRNQIISYLVVAVCLIAVGTGLYTGGKRFVGMVMKGREDARLAKEAAAAEAQRLAEENSDDGFSGEVIYENPGDTETFYEEEVPQHTDAELLDEMVDGLIADMPLKDKVAGLFMVTPEQLTNVDAAVKAGDGTEEALQKFAVGGLIYGQKNIKSDEQIQEMLQKTGNMSKYPLFLAATEPGGADGDITKALSLEAIPSPSELAEGGDANAAKEAGEAIAKRMADVGFSLNLAPFVNLTTESMSDSERALSYGSDATLAIGILTEEIKAEEENGVHTVAMMFPSLPSSDESNSTKATSDDLSGGEFRMFSAAIDAGSKIVMVGDLTAPELVGDETPCTLSSVVIEDTLRGTLDFDGVVMTAALDSKAITEKYEAAQAAVEAVKAGADILYRPADFEAAMNGVVDAVNSGTIPENRIDQSLRRIYRIKYADKMVG